MATTVSSSSSHAEQTIKETDRGCSHGNKAECRPVLREESAQVIHPASCTCQFDWQYPILGSIDGADETRETARECRLCSRTLSALTKLDAIGFAVAQRSQLDLSLTGLSIDADECIPVWFSRT